MLVSVASYMSELTPGNKPKNGDGEDLNASFKPNLEYYRLIGAEYFPNGRELLGSKAGRAAIMAALDDDPSLMWPESAEWIADNLRGQRFIALKRDESMAPVAFLLHAAQAAITEDCDVLIQFGKNFSVVNPGDGPASIKDKIVAHKLFFDYATEFFEADRIQIFSPEDLEHMRDNYGFDLAANERFIRRELDGAGFKLMRVDPGQTFEVCVSRAVAAAQKLKAAIVFVHQGEIQVIDQNSTETGAAAMAQLRRFLRDSENRG